MVPHDAVAPITRATRIDPAHGERRSFVKTILIELSPAVKLLGGGPKGKLRPSSRRPKQRLDPLAQRRCAGEIADHVAPFAKRDPDRVVTADTADKSVTQRLTPRRLGEGSEYPVEHDQDAAVVLVEAGRIRRVVHAVMGGRVENPFQWTQPGHELGVDEKLVEQVDAKHADHGKGMESDKDQRQEERSEEHT